MLEIQASLDLLHDVVAKIGTTHQQMRAQLDHQAQAVQESSRLHDVTTRVLAALQAKLDIGEQDPSSTRPPAADDANQEAVKPMGTGFLRLAAPDWTGNGVVGSTSARPHDHGNFSEGGDGLLGSGVAVVGGGRQHVVTGEGPVSSSLPKMSFPRFEGDQPSNWKDKCLDYFRIFNIHPALWLTTATLHMDGRAALWLQAYKLCHDIGTWPQFISVVEAKFGVDDQRKVMKALLTLKQSDTVEEYHHAFEQLVYTLLMRNPHYDEQFFVSQFIRGLETEFRAAVES